MEGSWMSDRPALPDVSYTVQKEEPERLILLMQRENFLYMTDTIDVASFMADFYVLYKFTC
jgi:hypothetical protein